MIMTYFNKMCVFSAMMTLSLSACGGAVESDGDHPAASSATRHGHEDESAVDHNQFGHMSAIYICGNDELQTTHTDEETKLAYKGQKIDVARTVSVIDNAFAGESFKGRLNGQSLFFRGKGYDASLKIGDQVIGCEKISCIPLGGPH